MFVQVSETYDLSTQIGKMGFVAIHTPDLQLIKKMWKGLLMNHRYYKFQSCDLAMACASMLPADPLQVGVESGEIAPQDMFNSILYRAVSNDSYNTILNRIQNKYQSPVSGVDKNSVISDNSDSLADVDQFDLYYGLLAEPSGWRKAMPQNGLQMSNLYPMVFQLVSNVGNNTGANTGSAFSLSKLNSMFSSPGLGDDQASAGGVVQYAMFRGPSMRMPRIPTFGISSTSSEIIGDDVTAIGEFQSTPITYVACIVLPPAKLNVLYYRLKVTWTIEFSEPYPATEIANYTSIANIGNQSYGSDYDAQSNFMSVKTSSVDAKDANVQKIMESGR
ncbi:putative capsid protein [Fly associated circular virus 4]|uniref:Putative capsid protein n=1 Tax=Fly associated circular virus 4 TaxID=2293284 RepID=A0A346BPB5_9VIRU|nr:putative capsid protein [Fly associated circular virus 4]AXL65912.1 putative capsid protein [Fly associated circular virus 4]